jgi:hypothetical protein
METLVGQAKNWIYPKIGARKLRDFTATDADNFFKELGWVLSKQTLVMIKSTLRRSIRRAQVHNLWVPITLSLPLNWSFLAGQGRVSSASGCGLAMRCGTLSTRVTMIRLPCGAAGVRLAPPCPPAPAGPRMPGS